MGIARKKAMGLSIATLALLAVAACDENGEFSLGQGANSESAASAAPVATGKTVERDVEAPEVFSATEAGLWDGRPSLGGVWIAHPDVKDPERVIIRNTANGKFVVGALFRRERDIPGPRLQISSDAATSLGMLAGAPAELNVTALRREEVPEEVPTPAPEDIPTVEAVSAPSEIEATPLDPIAAASAAIDAPAPTKPQAASQAAAPAPAKAAPKPRSTSSLKKPFLQVGIFSVESNANRTAARMRSAGMVPTVRRGETNGKAFWRVIVGPANNSSERTALLDKIKSEGFTDAYPVTN
ncbi:MAG: SPOR domain-containing protein [Aliishimia sp.]